VSVKIRLKRMGGIRKPYYRIVAVDERAPRDGKALEELGIYHPIESKEKQLSFDEAKVRAWVEKGAQPTSTVRSLLNSKNFFF
jgi:small subunit ribosomal protein S16